MNPFCEITVDSLTLKTPFIKRTINPKWNVSMQFPLFDLAEDIIHINIFDNKFFSPNGLFTLFKKKTMLFFILENIGSTSIRLLDILPCSLDIFLTQPSHAFTQTIYLNNGSSLVIKCAVQLLLPYQ